MSEFEEQNPITIDFEQIEQVAKVFFDESAEILQALDSLILHLEANPSDTAALNDLFRRVHTLKGSVGPVPGGQLLGSLAHEFEALLSKLKKEQAPANKECIDLFLHSSKLLKILAEALRDKSDILPEVLSEVIEVITRFGQIDISSVSTPVHRTVSAENVVAQADDGIWLTSAQLNEMLKISGEILVLKNHFQYMSQTNDFHSKQSEFGQQLQKISDRFQQQMGKALKVEALECFKSLNTLVRQASTELNKEVVFTTLGFDLLIDKNLGRDINEAMVHLIRNSLDHGIEDPFDRATSGKPSIGQLRFEISEKNNLVRVLFSDDGRGLDRDKISDKAVEKQLCTAAQAQTLSDREIYQFIFHPGFSTKEKITTISGRGVGMDVVHQIVQKYHGQVLIETHAGQGTTFILELETPQHMVMESTILCSWQDLQLALPVSSVLQIISLADILVTDVGSVRYGQWNGQTVPLLNYEELCENKKSHKPVDGSVLFIRYKEHILGFVIDRVIGQVDLMVKNFGGLISGVPGVRGTAILADDRVTYVLDPEKLVQLISEQGSKSEGKAA